MRLYRDEHQVKVRFLTFNVTWILHHLTGCQILCQILLGKSKEENQILMYMYLMDLCRRILGTFIFGVHSWTLVSLSFLGWDL